MADGPLAELLGGHEDAGGAEQLDAALVRPLERVLEEAAEGEAGDHGRDRPDDEEPEDPAARGDVGPPAEHAEHQPEDLVAEVDEQGHQRPHVEQDGEAEGRLSPAQHARDEHQVTAGGDGEEFGQSLDETEDDFVHDLP